jgi:hypothetical protein
MAVLLGAAEPRGEGDAGAEGLALVLRERGEQRRVDQASRLWLCCAAAPVPEPPGRRTTIGTVALPPNMKWIFAA